MSDIWERSVNEFETYCKNNRFSAYIGNDTVLASVLGNHKFFLSPIKDVGTSASLVKDGYWESPTSVVMARSLKQYDVCIDVGANCGYFSCIMASKSSKVYAYEPNINMIDNFKKTIKANGYQNKIELLNKAVFSDCSRKILSFPSDDYGTGSLFANFENILDVDCVTIDSIYKNKKVDLIKIDAEGSELDILNGAVLTLSNNPNIIILLEHNLAYYNKEIDSLLHNLDFKIWSIDNNADLKKVSYDKDCMFYVRRH